MRPVRFSRPVVQARGLQIWIDCGRVVWAPDRRTSCGRASTWVGSGSERHREGRSDPSGLVCYSPVFSWLAPDRGVAAHASCGWGPVVPVGCRRRWTACSAPRLLPVATVVTSHHVLRMLAVIWLHPTRLETRTKESNMCASLRVIETRGRNESEGSLGCWGENLPRGEGASSTDLFYS